MNIVAIKDIDELDGVFFKYINEVLPTQDGGWLSVGMRPDLDVGENSYSLAAWTSKMSAMGDSIWERMDTVIWNTNTPGGWGEVYQNGAVELPSGSIITCGYSKFPSPTGARAYAFLLKMDKDGCIEPGCWRTVNTVNLEKIPSLRAYPNPITSEHLTIEGDGIFDVSIYDLSGRLITEKPRQRDMAVLDCTDWASGVYFAKIKIDGIILTKKLIKE